MSERTCSIEGCDKRARSRGWCDGHYQRWQKYGNPTVGGPLRKRDRGSLEQRFWSKVDKNGPVPECRPGLGPCWIWQGATTGTMKYGVLQRGGRGEGQVRAHRLSWELANGQISGDLVPDHLCRIPQCVNPDHLELVTFKENVLRGDSAGARNARKTHCPEGHELGTADQGWRKRCGECNRAWKRKRYHAKKSTSQDQEEIS